MNFKLFLKRYTEFLERLFSRSKRNIMVGIDITTSSVKAVEICGMKNVVEIRRWALVPIENGDTKAALKRLFTRMNIKDQIPVVSVSGKGTLVRYVDMLRMSLQEVKKSFKYEVDKYFPFDPQSIYTDCYIVNPKAKEKKMTVMLVAVKKEMVDERIKLFKEIGMELAYVTTNSVATANAFENALEIHDGIGAKAILDIGASESSLMILDKNGFPCFTRDIFIGIQDISKGAMDNLANEIQLSFDYCSTDKNVLVKELFLSGIGALSKGTAGLLEKDLHLPVKTWDPLAGLRLGVGVVSSQIEPFSSELGVAVGLALTKI